MFLEEYLNGMTLPSPQVGGTFQNICSNINILNSRKSFKTFVINNTVKHTISVNRLLMIERYFITSSLEHGLEFVECEQWKKMVLNMIPSVNTSLFGGWPLDSW